MCESVCFNSLFRKSLAGKYNKDLQNIKCNYKLNRPKQPQSGLILWLSASRFSFNCRTVCAVLPICKANQAYVPPDVFHCNTPIHRVSEK